MLPQSHYVAAGCVKGVVLFSPVDVATSISFMWNYFQLSDSMQQRRMTTARYYYFASVQCYNWMVFKIHKYFTPFFCCQKEVIFKMVMLRSLLLKKYAALFFKPQGHSNERGFRQYAMWDVINEQKYFASNRNRM